MSNFAWNIDKDESEWREDAHPPGHFQDRTMKMFNSLCADNVKWKAKEMKKQFANCRWRRWLTFYIIHHRVAKEPNLHATYITFLENLDLPKLLDNVLSETYDCLQDMLRKMDTAVHSMSHRATIKNLGRFLGLITLGKNQPLDSKQLDLGALLVDGYTNGHLTVVVPLVCKIVEGVPSSDVFSRPCTSTIMSLLAEIHDVPHLKSNLLFEIEILCRNLNVELDTLARSSLLRNQGIPQNTHDWKFVRPQQSPAEPAEVIQSIPQNTHDWKFVRPQQSPAEPAEVKQQEYDGTPLQEVLGEEVPNIVMPPVVALREVEVAEMQTTVPHSSPAVATNADIEMQPKTKVWIQAPAFLLQRSYAPFMGIAASGDVKVRAGAQMRTGPLNITSPAQFRVEVPPTQPGEHHQQDLHILDNQQQQEQQRGRHQNRPLRRKAPRYLIGIQWKPQFTFAVPNPTVLTALNEHTPANERKASAKPEARARGTSFLQSLLLSCLGGNA